MSFLRKGETRWGKRSALVTAAAVGAFQVLAIIGAGAASAATNCTYDPSSDTITVTIDPNGSANLAVDNGTSGVVGSATGDIVLSTDFGSTWVGTCGSATNDNTQKITVLGQPSSDETFVIDEYSLGADQPQFNPAIAWAVDLGTGTNDWFEWWGNDNTAADDNVVVTDDGFTLNGATGELHGEENIYLYGGDGDDVLDASGVSDAVYTEIYGVDGDDWIAPGAYNGDYVEGDNGTDTLSYETRTTCTRIENGNVAGQDANCDGDLLDVGDEADTVADDFEVLATGTGNDSFLGDPGFTETFVPGDGDDDIVGQSADADVVDYSTSSAAVTIDPAAGTVSGQGDDTITDIADFVGSPFDDTLVWDGTTNSFDGGDGWDTVDASADTSTGVNIDLDVLDGGGPVDTLEEAIGGTGNDTLTGNDLRNILDGGDGDDTLSGAAGNDRLVGGEGNDTYSGGTGADTISFGGATQGVTVDVSLGFASGQGDDSIANDIEIVSGSKFSDNITTGQTGTGGSLNFRVRGRAGSDLITGSTSNDTLLGGAGNDVIRAGNGDDILRGGKGRDRGFGGGGDDVCRGIERERGCEA